MAPFEVVAIFTPVSRLGSKDARLTTYAVITPFAKHIGKGLNWDEYPVCFLSISYSLKTFQNSFEIYRRDFGATEWLAKNRITFS